MKSIIIIFLAVTLAVALDESIDNPERIINGKPAAHGQFPYQVYLQSRNWNDGWRCGGSLISSEWVLTAAHCTSKMTDEVEVHLGGINWQHLELSFIVDINNFIQHEDYDDKTLSNDIALIKIPPVEFTDNITKIELPKIKANYSEYIGKKVVVSGWGNIDDNGNYDDILRYAEMIVISNEDCSKERGKIFESTICASPIHGTNTCGGDSGGPMALSDSKILIGVTSFGSAKCEDGSAAGFARVTSYLDWIAKNTGIQY